MRRTIDALYNRPGAMAAGQEGHEINGRVFQVSGDDVSLVTTPGPSQHYPKAGGWKVEDVFEPFPRSFQPRDTRRVEAARSAG